MAHGKSESELLAAKHNTARFFVETRQLSWVLLAATIAWGVYGYLTMPERKDPDVPVRDAVAIVSWPGASAEAIEQLVTRKVEEAMYGNAWIEHVTSTTRTSVAIVHVALQKTTPDIPKQFDDIRLRLDAIHDLPDGAGPIQFIKDFGDTAGLLLTVASPRLGPAEIALRARAIGEGLARARGGATGEGRAALVFGFPPAIPADAAVPMAGRFARFAERRGLYRQASVFDGPGFVGIDGATDADEAALRAAVSGFLHENARAEEIHPDVWGPLFVREASEVEARLATAPADRYGYRELDEATKLLQRTLETVPSVAKVTRSGVLDERVDLVWSQERLASYGVRPDALSQALGARNVSARGGIVEAGGRSLQISPSGEFRSEREIGDVLVSMPGAPPVYLRDLVEVVRGYETPARYLNWFTRPLPDGRWERTRAITLAVQMRSGEQIAGFGRAVDAALHDVATRLPDGLVLARTSDQPLQVKENVDLFMSSLWEAVFLVVLVSLLGFWEWRSAVLMALSIPITLAMTFGMMRVLGIDLQQVSIASLIIALGLLVDDPVVAGDAVKRDLAAGKPRRVAAWLGPTKLATAIMFATVTNIVAYLPFLLLTGDTGRFLYSLPIVITCSLVASRLVSMTFIPLLGYYLLRPRAEKPIAARRETGFASRYYRLGRWAIAHRWAVLGASLVFLAAGGAVASRLRTQFFPKDLQYLSYVDVWLPEDAPLSATSAAAEAAERVIREVAEEEGRAHGGHGDLLVSLTTFAGGGAPRFWLSAAPEQSQLNYAQIILLVKDKHFTTALVDPLQRALSARVPGAHIDVRQLETGAAVGLPVAIRLSGEDIPTLRRLAEELKAMLRAAPGAARVRDDWGAETFSLGLRTDADRANAAGLTNRDVAAASAGALSGQTVGTLRDGEHEIPIVARLRMDERARLEDLANLYVFSQDGKRKVPVGLVASLDHALQTERIQRRDKFRTVTVGAYPAEGVLPSEVLKPLLPRLKEFEARLPPGYRLEVGGEHEKQVESFGELAMVMAISIGLIFLALVLQFRNAVKPFIVFAAIPYGVVGAVAMLAIMGAPFGFMAFLGVASLVGVIVSHVIVLFDFIEEAHAQGEPLEQALLDAGILRLRPVLITVGATVIALVPLAMHGGPLWEPLCYAQIGGLCVATFVTLLLVPVLYAIVVRDLKLVRWDPEPAPAATPPSEAAAASPAPDAAPKAA
ncbi:MAG TPA: efflux RND transporter permease subunit [Anaeromyxobacteraceae bacterium]|nr:efflux RND transporter permease subunit [Anaeromyxobacteraceae bacterium]